MPFYICIDCGGSKTSAVICDESGNIVGRALGGPSNLSYLGVDAFLQAVDNTVSKAWLNKDEASRAFHLASIGISGCDTPAAINSVTPGLSKILGIPSGPRLQIANDTHLLAAPLASHPNVKTAIAVIAGTGSVCVALEQSDDELTERGRTGGYGWMLGDEGGGFHVGREAVRQFLMDEESIYPRSSVAESPLKQAMLAHFNVSSAMEILTAVHQPDPIIHSDTVSGMLREKRLSSLAPHVFNAAFKPKSGHPDPFALRILRQCSTSLAIQVQSLLRNTQIDAADSIICFGGTLAGVAEYRIMITAALQSLDGRCVFRHVEYLGDVAVVGAQGLATAARLALAPGVS